MLELQLHSTKLKNYLIINLAFNVGCFRVFIAAQLLSTYTMDEGYMLTAL
jgi:hypothetical protein